MLVSQMTLTTDHCPACRLPMAVPGRLVAGVDDAGQAFVFAICSGCTARLNRLRPAWQVRELEMAIRRLEKRPDLYLDVKFFESEDQARLFCRLEADCLGVTSA